MAVENYFLSREGRVLSAKILKFLRSLIIKINTEANDEETKETYTKWLEYKYAYEGTDDIYAYSYDIDDCNKAGISGGTVTTKRLLDQDFCFKLCLANDNTAMTLLLYLRKERINNYVENNSYYSQFLGLPRLGQEIKIANKDKISDLDPDSVYLHEIDIVKNPLTYEYVYVTGLIDKIISDHQGYYYLKYLMDPKSIYVVRNTEQFDIIDYNKSILNETELKNFFEIYDRKKVYFNELMYIKGYDVRMTMYPFLMEVLLLQDVFMSFFNSYMDNFALANYSDQEIYDILDSYNLSSLKRVKMSTLRKLIRDIPSLMELKGSDLVIEKILDIVADESVTIKRYYLTKTFPVDSRGETKYDTTKTYDENLSIGFKEKVIRSSIKTVETADSLQDYGEFVDDDNTWGGDLEGLTDVQKTHIKEKFKRELMGIDFSSILTKYLTISSTVNSYNKQVKLQNYIGLLWQWLRKNTDNNFLINNEISFNSFILRPIDMYAAICWIYRHLNGVPNSDIIDIKNFNVANVLALQDSGVDSLVNNISNTVISLPQGLGDKTVGEILGYNDKHAQNTNTDDIDWPFYRLESDNKNARRINYNSTIISFKPDSTISELFGEYEKNALILSKLKERWMRTSKLDEAKAWEYLIEQNQTNTYFEVMFDEYSSFSDFIRSYSPEFNSYLSTMIRSDNFEALYSIYGRLLESFREYILESTDNIISLTTMNGDNEDSSIDYLEDLKILFNAFMSIYTELHKVEYSQTIEDSPYNRIKLLYYYTKDIIYNDFRDKVYIDGKIKTDKKIDKYIFQMMKEDKLKSLSAQINDSIEGKDNFSKLSNTIISKLETSNILEFVNDRIYHLNKLSDTVGSLSESDTDLLNICTDIVNILSEDRDHLYSEILDLISGSKSGGEILILYNEDEINYLNEQLDFLNKREDMLPHFKTYIESFLFEYYTEKIELIYKIQTDSSVDYQSDKLYLTNKYIETIISHFTDDLKLSIFYKESNISYTSFFKDYFNILKYKSESDEYFDIMHLKLNFNYELKDDLTINLLNDNLKLKYKIEEK